ncbi:peptidase M28-like protein [Taibaiella chishuiensis]|uniref:Peptidase M28-like protein n=2 Tax=Taibaiella chishuiensis TaxID=1434707 RepID=A0A2P8CWI1_9BACT|nr:peptidase M28-like protein [Taibaiella chishuiensis]
MRKGKNKESSRVKSKKFEFFYCLFLFINHPVQILQGPVRHLFYLAAGGRLCPAGFIMKRILISGLFSLLLTGIAYGRQTTGGNGFNADSAYAFTARQVAFGPRVPNSPAQLACAAWLGQKLAQYCDTVYRQQVTVTAGDGATSLRCINLVGVINPAATRRILLLAHWDSRPWADRDRKKKKQAIDGADDGASGTAVLLELARVLQNSAPGRGTVGVDILLADVEDYGKDEWQDASYALGTQYWCHNPHVAGYTAEAGILLDMVGGSKARFPMEGFSRQYASPVVDAVWQAAAAAGHSAYFPTEKEGYITDDHVPVNTIRHIPTIDMIHLPRHSETGFPEHWHTHRDNMSVIDKHTLQAVGETLLYYLRHL